MVKPSQLLNNMVSLIDVKVGDKIKSELRAISCATGKKNKQVDWKHRWVVVEVDDEKIKVEDNKGNTMFFDKNGRGFMPNTNHFIYKVK